MKIGSLLLISYILNLIIDPLQYPLLLLFTVHTPLWTCLADNEAIHSYVSYLKYLIELKKCGLSEFLKLICDSGLWDSFVI